MNRLTLDLEELRVDSFATSGAKDETRTARDWAWSDESICPSTAPSRVCPV
jgi:hypothetical protein